MIIRLGRTLGRTFFLNKNIKILIDDLYHSLQSGLLSLKLLDIPNVVFICVCIYQVD